MGIEPTFEAWEAPVLPLNYTRDTCLHNRDSHHCVTGLLRTVATGIHASRDTCTSVYIVPVLRPSGQRLYAPLFQIAPGNLVEPTFEAWEAPVLPLNYTRPGARVGEFTTDCSQESPPDGKD
jgi:hypothetical protein